MSRSTFYRRIWWCWKVRPQPIPTGQIHRYLMLDGTYFNGYCVLTAFNGTYVVDWQFCDREKSYTWDILIQRIPAPDIAVIDGASSLESVIRQHWPETKIQRCHFHIRQNITTNLTNNPRTKPGQELQAIAHSLRQVTNLDQAAHWEATLVSWMTLNKTTLDARTYAHQSTGPKPSYVRSGQQWWYTHRGLRRTARLLAKLVKTNQLFTYLEHATNKESLPKTTSPLEGAINSGIKDLLRNHRGLSPEHAITAVAWYLYHRQEKPAPAWDLVTPEHWQAKQRKIIIDNETIGPALYDNHYSKEDGNGIQKGWAGQS